MECPVVFVKYDTSAKYMPFLRAIRATMYNVLKHHKFLCT